MDTAQCGNYGNLVSHFFGKNFVKATVLLNKSLELIRRNIFSVRPNLSFFHTVHCAPQCGKREIHCHNNFFRQNDLVYSALVKS